MAFTTISGSAGSPDSFFGTDGVDTIILGALASGAWLGSRQSGDLITLNSASSSVRSFTLNTGAGNDTLGYVNATGLDSGQLFADSGNDTLNLAAVSKSTIRGGQGTDQISTAGLVLASRINGNQGSDQINHAAGATSSEIFGGIEDDTITLATAITASLVQANEGDDVITIAAGTSLARSTINGNQSNDSFTIAAISSDSLTTIFGGEGNDTLNAANSIANLALVGDNGNDSIFSGSGNDRISGGDGDDDIRGRDGNDTINSGSGNDRIFANQGNDLVEGGEGNDDIQSGQGDDSVDGGAGNDTVSGSGGNDNLTGGAGADRFIFETTQALNGTDTITDFNLTQADNLTFDFGADGNATQGDLRGTGVNAQRLAAGAALDINTGLVISSASIADATAAKLYAEGLIGENAGDSIYLLGSTNSAGSAVTTLYSVSYAGIGNATAANLGTFGSLAIADFAAAQITQFSII